MRILEEVGSVLRAAGYTVRKGDDNRSVWFEDYSLLGSVSVYDSVEELTRDWRRVQDSFLQRHAPFLRSAQEKVWNCYTVHLTPEQPTPAVLQRLIEIEEDFVSTRKIARAGTSTELDVLRALLPLLPIQNLVRTEEETHVVGLARRLHDWPSGAATALLRGVDAEKVLELLMDEAS